MYSTKEKIHIFRKLSCPDVVEADLALLHEKAPHLTDFIRFDFAPRKNHEDILFCLLDFCEQDEIIRYRREFFAAADGEENNSPTDGDCTDNQVDGEGNDSPAVGTDNQADGEGNDSPTDGDGTDNQADGEGNDSPTDGDGTDNQADGEGNDSPTDGDDTDNPTDGEGNESAAENNKTPVVDNSVDNSSEKGRKQSKDPVTPKKKKKNTRK
ncbi:hypothetical protein [Alloprevotella tannerae]|uniref:hypothetical protein n=1 Tax=Alloprevotella tannerae TaxID=76122 RepID=UPI0028E9CA8E|nr:hypothetical protein [Alloprevotella tannerae]